MHDVRFAGALLLLAAAPTVAQAQAVQPGQWQIVTTINSMEMAGAPPGIAAMLKGRPITVKHCLTAQEAAQGPQEMLKANKQCRIARYSMAAGKLNSVVVCSDAGGTMTSTSSGTFTPTSFTTTGTSVRTGQGAMTMKASSAGKRIGDCKK